VGTPDGIIAALLIKASIANYPGSCACPYPTARAGRAANEVLTQSPAGGYPLCFEADVTPAMIGEYVNGKQLDDLAQTGNGASLIRSFFSVLLSTSGRETARLTGAYSGAGPKRVTAPRKVVVPKSPFSGDSNETLGSRVGAHDNHYGPGIRRAGLPLGDMKNARRAFWTPAVVRSA
jgi:hypothetical protein